MSHHNTFPSAEDCTTPESSVEFLAEELRLYPDQESLRDGLRGISALYAKVTVGRSLVQASRMMFYAAVQNGQYEGQPINPRLQIDNEFYAGSVLGLHVHVRPLIDLQRYVVYASGFGVVDEDYALEDRIDAAENMISQMHQFRHDNWQGSFECLEEDMQALVYQGSIVLTEGEGVTPRAAGYSQDSFMAGFTYGAVRVGYAMTQWYR